MNKESRGNILESTQNNILVPQHKNSVLNADVSSERGSSSQAPVLIKYSFFTGHPRLSKVPYFSFI